MKAIHPGPRIARLLRRVRVDVAGFIAQDRACCRCGYNLRGLRPEGRCPECGTNIAATLLAPTRKISTRAVITIIIFYRLLYYAVPLLFASGVAVIAIQSLRRLISYYHSLNEAF